MDLNQTQTQNADEQLRSQTLSDKPSRPPTQIPGYEPRRFLGSGAYGEVWVALDRTTGRQVAVKFYAHQGGLDWSILSREVEKLAFLSADRYVVQLLDVGWDASPPYYVMEYIEQGSLDDLLKREGSMGVREAVGLFREVAVGLLHAHAKGVLHCDLKPANVLLDQDMHPRLADFGQSRLSHEQTPALGTLFYMAPEQADLQAVPDVRWDVYALGALLYCMLTGAPPYRSESAVTKFDTATNLEDRLARYRHLIATSPLPTRHRKIPGVDRELADLIDGCLAPNRHERFANVQEVLDALQVRERRRARRPLVLLGFVGPALLLAIVSLFAWRSFDTVMADSDQALRNRALDGNRFAAKYVAKTVTNKLEILYNAVEEMAVSPRFQALLESALDDPEMSELRMLLNNPHTDSAAREALRLRLVASPARRPLQERLERLLQEDGPQDVASWFVTDPSGLQLARAPEYSTVGENFSWRTYFHGGQEDYPKDWRAGPQDHITSTNLSAVFFSQVNDRWTVTISTPVVEEADDGQDGRFLGVLGLSIDVHQVVEVPERERQLVALVDWRPGPNKGLIMQHPLFDQLLEEHQQIPDRFQNYRLTDDELPKLQTRESYVDPLSRDELGKAYDAHWLAETASVGIRDGYTGWMVIVQERYDNAIGRTLGRLRDSLLEGSLMAGGLIAILSMVLWGFVIRALADPSRAPNKPLGNHDGKTS